MRQLLTGLMLSFNGPLTGFKSKQGLYGTIIIMHALRERTTRFKYRPSKMPAPKFDDLTIIKAERKYPCYRQSCKI
jgi:hypothetical protein